MASKRNRPTVVITPQQICGRDDIAQREVADILSVFPDNHPARLAFANYRSTAAITYLVNGRQDIIDALVATDDRVRNRIYDESRGNLTGHVQGGFED